MTISRILVVGHTHHDVGYTNSPRLIDGAHARIVGEVLDLADAHPGDGPDAPDRFRWTFEVARPVLAFLAGASDRDVERLRARVAAGDVAVTGGYLNMTQLPDDAEFVAAYRALDAFRRAGIPVRTEQHGDVNGIAWGAADRMLDAGIDRLVMALNPDHGRAPLEQPSLFRWETPSGRLLTVLLSTHYGVGEEWGVVDGDLARAEDAIRSFVDRLAERDDYPFRTAIVHAANDNRWPTTGFLDVVRHWNPRHPELPMATATIDQALDALLAEAPAELPVLRGEWADWWAHGHGSTAREVAVYREARRFARAAAAAFPLAAARGEHPDRLATVLGYRRGPVRLREADEVAADAARVDEQLLLYGEHTWGSWETYRAPFSTFTLSHRNAKDAFAFGAYDLARDLAIEGMHRVAASGDGVPIGTAAGILPPHDAILVLNPTARDRREPVEAEVDGGRRVTLVVDAPASSLRLLPIPPAEPAATPGLVLETERYRVEVDAVRGGIASLVDRSDGRELVDAATSHGLGAIVIEVVPDAERAHPMFRDPRDFHPAHPGPRFDHVHGTAGDAELVETAELARLRWSSRIPGVLEAAHTVTLYRDSPVIDLAVRIDKPARLEPESIFVAFPWAIREPEFLVETAGAVFAADTEQLPDTSRDWYAIQHAVGVRGAGAAVLWGSVDAPLVQLGGFRTGRWARRLEAPAGHVNSWVMNNLHFTNFAARQEFHGTLRYRFRPAAAEGLRDAVRGFGDDLGLPLQARAVTAAERVE
jgi:hypothetical protein